MDKLNDMEFAKNIFKAWDTSSKGYLTAKEFAEQLVGLGLAQTSRFSQTLLQTLRGDAVRRDGTDKHVEVLTLKDFLKVFDYENFGTRACEIMKEEFKASLTVQLSKQKNIEMTRKEQIVQAQTAFHA